MSAPSSGPQGELSTWKELAAYLGVSVRTAQLWEHERGLPVRRLPGSRSRVSIRVDELEEWRLGAFEKTDPAELPPSPPARLRSRSLLWVAVAVFVCLATAGWAWWTRTPATPAGWKVEGQVLTVFDANGRELWRKAFDQPMNEAEYRNAHFPRVKLVDLDGDSRPEVVFAVLYNARRTETVYIYSPEGRELGKFEPDITLRTAAGRFDPPWGTLMVEGLPARGGRPGIALVLSRNHHYPSLITSLAGDGRVLQQYRHSGGLYALALNDRRTAKPLVYSVGWNEGASSATVVALDPYNMSGCSREESPAVQFADCPDAPEVRRLLLPRSCINRETEPFGFAQTISHMGNDWIVNSVDEGVFKWGAAPVSSLYSFDDDLNLRRVEPWFSFSVRHRELRRAGRVGHDLTDREIQQLSAVRRLD